MHFQTVLPSILVLAFASSSSLVAAENAGCHTCFVNAVKGISNCGSLPDVKLSLMDVANPWAWNQAQKQCFCALASDMTWANQCSTADTCGVDFGAKEAAVFSSNKTYCEFGSTTKNSANMVKAATGVAFAFTAAVAQAIL